MKDNTAGVVPGETVETDSAKARHPGDYWRWCGYQPRCPALLKVPSAVFLSPYSARVFTGQKKICTWCFLTERLRSSPWCPVSPGWEGQRAFLRTGWPVSPVTVFFAMWRALAAICFEWICFESFLNLISLTIVYNHRLSLNWSEYDVSIPWMWTLWTFSTDLNICAPTLMYTSAVEWNATHIAHLESNIRPTWCGWQIIISIFCCHRCLEPNCPCKRDASISLHLRLSVQTKHAARAQAWARAPWIR